MNESELRNYFEKDLGWGSNYQSGLVFDLLRKAASHASGGPILDAGSGYQRYRPFFDSCLYLGQEHPVAGVVNKEINQYDILCDVRQIPLQDESLRAILSTSSLEHMEYPDDFFKESFRTLLPGGGLFVQVPFMYLEHEAPFDFQRPTRYGLRRWFEYNGFQRVAVEPASSSMYSAITIMNWALQQQPFVDNSVGIRIRRKLIQKIWPRITWWLTRIYDKPPTQETLMPIGWVATGFKPGQLEPAEKLPDRNAFLSDRRLPHTRMQDGALYSTYWTPLTGAQP